MIYLLDADVLIRAHEDHYPIDRVPQFWEWIENRSIAGTIKIPFEIHDEIATSKGLLHDWVCDPMRQPHLILDEEIDQNRLQQVFVEGYQINFSDAEVEKTGRDPFLITYALGKDDRTVVTRETSKPSRTGANQHIPDVCRKLNIPCINDFKLYRELNFTTKESARSR